MKTQGRQTEVLVLLSAMVLMVASASWAADEKKDQSDVSKGIEKSAEVLNEIMGTPDKAIPDKVMADPKCIAVGFGGNHGKAWQPAERRTAGAFLRRSRLRAAAGACNLEARLLIS